MAESMANAGGTSRRRMLQAGAAGVGAVALTGLGGALRNDRAVASSGGCPMGGGAAHTPAATFGRIFDDLPPFAANTSHLRQALLKIGAPGGMLDANDDLFGPGGGPVNLITDPTLSLINKNNPHDTAGMTFVGQFIDHDLTFDATSKLGVTTDPSRSPNSRSARFDLDSVYGGGPIAQSELYDPAHPIKFLLESGGQFEDVPRRADHSAIIGDPRNDSNLIVSGLHAAFLKFHNNAVDEVSTAGAEAIDVFNQARELTVWHYQWLVVNRILPNFVGQSMVDDVLRHGPRYFRAEREPYIPVEFSGAAYRFGHSMVRPSYRANLAGDNGGPFFGLIFDSRIVVPDGQNPTVDPGDLRGGLPLVATVHRLADILRFRRRLQRPDQAQQADRHDPVDATVRPANDCDRAHHGIAGADLPSAADAAAAPDLVAAVRAVDRPADGRAGPATGRPRRLRSCRPAP